MTEAHLGCTREEQLRWLKEVWDGAQRLRQEGADVRAVTAWSLLGAFDWHNLLTRDEGHYEPGDPDRLRSFTCCAIWLAVKNMNIPCWIRLAGGAG